MKRISLTGDRPSGKLHLGHYVGSLKTRLSIQNEYESYILIADSQAMTDIADYKYINQNIIEVMKDYLSIGLDSSIFCLQSEVLELYELSFMLMNYISLNRLMQNPTLKQEIKLKENVNLGFLLYPIAQAADILGFNADIVPVGEDQMPIIEQTNAIVHKVNDMHQKAIFKPVKAILSDCSRLVGIDGKHKASKTLNNAIYLSDSDEEIAQKVYKMYTDPKHIKVSDPGRVEGNVVFEYLDAFAQKEEVMSLKAYYQKGGLGDMVIKKILIKNLTTFIGPIRDKRNSLKNADVLDRLVVDTQTSSEYVKQNIEFYKNILR